MNIIRQRLDAGRKFYGVRLDEALRVALALPAIINVDVLIAGVLHAVGRHRVGHRADNRFVHAGGEFVPAVPAHRRRLGEVGEFLRVQAGGGKNGE